MTDFVEELKEQIEILVDKRLAYMLEDNWRYRADLEDAIELIFDHCEIQYKPRIERSGKKTWVLRDDEGETIEIGIFAEVFRAWLNAVLPPPEPKHTHVGKAVKATPRRPVGDDPDDWLIEDE